VEPSQRGCRRLPLLVAGARNSGSVISREALLRRAAGGAAALLLVERAPTLRLLEAPAAVRAAAPRTRHFVSRTDLRPPIVTVTTRAAELPDGLLFLAPSSGPGQRGAMIVDDRGELVWFRPSTPSTTMNFRPGVFRGEPVLTWWEGRFVRGVGRVGEYVVMSNAYLELARLPAGGGLPADFHEVLLTAENTLLVTAYETTTADLTPVGGRRGGRVYAGVVQELEVPTGRVLWEWHSLEHVPVTESMSDQIGDPYDYFHVNAVDVDHDGNLLVSARNTWTVYKVARRSGEVLWRLGGKRSSFTMGPGTTFAFQHDARSHRDGRSITVFDNGPDPGQRRPESRALELRLDFARKRATLARELRHRPPLYARVTGNQQLLAGGDSLVTWGSTGRFTEYAANGAVRLDATLPHGGQNYRVFRFPWVGAPAEPPSLARRPGEHDTVHASWNGATEVAWWQLETGAKPERLDRRTRMPKRGFETELRLPPGARYAAVTALDARGRPLGRSRTIRA